MRYTIEGFSQEYAITLRKNIFTNGKEKLIKIDCTDLVILRWFVDFYPNMKKMTIDGQEYAWLSHKKLEEDLPLLDISKRACIERMQKLVEFDILKYKLLKEGGTFSLYTFGDNYINLLRSNADGIRSNNIGSDGQTADGIRSTNTGGIRSNNTGYDVQPANKDKSINNSSFNNSSVSTEEKKVRKQTSYDAILADIADPELKDLYYEFIKMRVAIKSPMTDRALKMLIDKVNEYEPTSIDRQKKLLENAIINNWKSVYPLKDENKQSSSTAANKTSTSGGNVFLELAKEQGIY